MKVLLKVMKSVSVQRTHQVELAEEAVSFLRKSAIIEPMENNESESYFSPVYEDNHLLVVEKRPNVPVQEDVSGDPDLLNVLKEYIKVKYNKPGNVFLGLVHRLDRPASGLMVFARTSKAASRLSDQFRRKAVEKTYRAVVVGNPPDQANLVDHLWKDSSKNMVSVVPASQKEGKRSELRLRTLTRSNGLALIEIELITGRSHQIRVQCSHAGFPLWGDYKYGDRNQPQNRNLALLSFGLAFDHPTQKERLSFKASMPKEEPWKSLPFGE